MLNSLLWGTESIVTAPVVADSCIYRVANDYMWKIELYIRARSPKMRDVRSSNRGSPPVSVAGRVVEIVIREGAGDHDFISWSEPRPPHGIILHYYIRIIESGKETLIKDYNSTTISWDTWRNKWKITTSENVKIQVSAFSSIVGANVL